jgi:hypothetical protein
MSLKAVIDLGYVVLAVHLIVGSHFIHSIFANRTIFARLIPSCKTCMGENLNRILSARLLPVSNKKMGYLHIDSKHLTSQNTKIQHM